MHEKCAVFKIGGGRGGKRKERKGSEKKNRVVVVARVGEGRNK
jgi:hypothetical protein